ncbi:uncharacterized protein TNIN_109341 [Trichonephila inaurata madagascariensis]|uniref:Uncharacterized protein n=1 Tax=Trichonephila inaurata madagascariensis TaxID=2747483 RepID=A0A8X6XWB4_9ARAC|nr:uncharacterized protein TNIN_109341 [Trichonephila inaurata madagascariensis]
MEKRLVLPAWNQDQGCLHGSLLSTLICSFCSAGITLILTGSVLAVLSRMSSFVSSFAINGIAILIIGTILVAFGGGIGLFTLCSRHKSVPKTSSAATAEITPDPLCLLPVYPSITEVSSKNVFRPQLLLLPGSLDPIDMSYNST